MSGLVKRRVLCSSSDADGDSLLSASDAVTFEVAKMDECRQCHPMLLLLKEVDK